MVFPFERVHDGTRHRVKDREKAEIFQAVCRAGTITRKEIASAVGARPTTVSNVVNELMADRLVSEGRVKAPGRQGRPEIFLHPVFDRLVAMGLFVVSREVKGALIGLDGSVLASSSVRLPADVDNTVVVDSIVDLGKQLAAMKPPSSELLGAGLSLPGGINVADRVWNHTARWRNIENIDLRQIEKRLGLSVTPARVVTTRLEHVLLADPANRTGGTLIFHWGYGIGAAYAHDGRVIQAADGNFAEIGHWKVTRDSPRVCLCGGAGCLETVASVWALAPELESRYGKIPEDEVEFASFFNRNGIEHDALIVTARRYVATSIANLIITLFPDRVFLYGPFIATQEAYDSLVEEVLRSVPPFARNHVRLENLPLEFEGETIGSTHHLFRKALRSLLTVRVTGQRRNRVRTPGKTPAIDFPAGSY